MTVNDASRDTMASRDAPSGSKFVSWWHLASVLLVICAVLSLSSRVYVHGEGYAERPIAAMVLLLWAAGVVYIVSVTQSLKRPPRVGFALGVSILARLILIPSTPIQEDDIYRYLWDGRVLAEGVSPYLYSPVDIETFESRPDEFSPGDAASLARLAPLSGVSDAVSTGFERINNRHYATIYPPVAQGVFWCFGALVPGAWTIEAQVTAMKSALLLFDVGILFLVVALLRFLGKDPGLVVIYGWCPLVLKELSNAGHMDAIPTFFLVASLLALLHRRGALAGLLLGAAVSAKIYAVLLLPLFLRRLGPRRGAALMVGLLVVVAASHYLVGDGRARYRETLLSFALFWENHDAVFLWLESFATLIVKDSTITVAWGRLEEIMSLSYLCALIASAAALGGCVLWSVLRMRHDTPGEEVVRRVFVLLAALFLLGPIGFPWYFVWCMPFMPCAKLRSWWILPCLLPTYYLRFWFDYQHEQGFGGFASGTAFFDNVVVSLEFGLFFVLAGVELRHRRRAEVRRASSQEGERDGGQEGDKSSS